MSISFPIPQNTHLLCKRDKMINSWSRRADHPVNYPHLLLLWWTFLSSFITQTIIHPAIAIIQCGICLICDFCFPQTYPPLVTFCVSEYFVKVYSNHFQAYTEPSSVPAPMYDVSSGISIQDKKNFLHWSIKNTHSHTYINTQCTRNRVHWGKIPDLVAQITWGCQKPHYLAPQILMHQSFGLCSSFQ